MRVPKRSVIFSGSMIESGALTETVLVMRVAARIFESFMTLRARRSVTGKELGGRDSGGAACLGDGAGLADALRKLEGQIVGAACIPDEVQVDFFASLGELVDHLVFGEEVLVALDFDGLEQVDDVLRHSSLELSIPTLELLGGHVEVEFILKLDALTEAARSLEHVLVIQRQENRLHVETNFLMFFDGHDDYPFPCSAALSPVPC